jgi:hypothetical protein
MPDGRAAWYILYLVQPDSSPGPLTGNRGVNHRDSPQPIHRSAAQAHGVFGTQVDGETLGNWPSCGRKGKSEVWSCLAPVLFRQECCLRDGWLLHQPPRRWDWSICPVRGSRSEPLSGYDSLPLHHHSPLSSGNCPLGGTT